VGSQEELGRVFERLYQCKHDDASSRQGLGLGLYLCREIVELHGGWISVESTPGVGTTFSFLLPAHVAASKSVSGPARRSVAGLLGSNHRALPAGR